jgi:hypothetical protein
MSNNSDIKKLTKLTKVNIQPELQPKCGFKNWSKCAKIFKKPRGTVMGLSFSVRNPDSAFDLYADLIPDRLKEFGSISFDVNREDIDSFELLIEDSTGLPKTREVAKAIKKLLKRMINNRVITTPLTLDIYNDFIDAYETDPDFKPRGEILEVLVLTYDCYIQAYLTDISSEPYFWNELNESSRQKYLETFHKLLDWRLKESFNLDWIIKARDFIKFSEMSLTYGINFKELINNYRSNIDLYIENILNILRDRKEDIANIDSQKNNLNLSTSVDYDSKFLTEHNSLKLYPDEKSYKYINKQAKAFESSLPELIAKYPGEYVLFEDYKVIDHDIDEDTLFDRLWKTEFVKERMAIGGSGIYCHLVPNEIEIDA